jgi:hypothetical protein
MSARYSIPSCFFTPLAKRLLLAGTLGLTVIATTSSTPSQDHQPVQDGKDRTITCVFVNPGYSGSCTETTRHLHVSPRQRLVGNSYLAPRSSMRENILWSDHSSFRLVSRICRRFTTGSVIRTEEVGLQDRRAWMMCESVVRKYDGCLTN